MKGVPQNLRSSLHFGGFIQLRRSNCWKAGPIGVRMRLLSQDISIRFTHFEFNFYPISLYQFFVLPMFLYPVQSVEQMRKYCYERT